MIRLATAADLDGIEQIYNAIPWRIAAAREQAGVIHTLCIHPAAAGLGYAFAGATEFFFQGFIHEILNCYEKAL